MILRWEKAWFCVCRSRDYETIISYNDGGTTRAAPSWTRAWNSKEGETMNLINVAFGDMILKGWAK